MDVGRPDGSHPCLSAWRREGKLWCVIEREKREREGRAFECEASRQTHITLNQVNGMNWCVCAWWRWCVCACRYRPARVPTRVRADLGREARYTKRSAQACIEKGKDTCAQHHITAQISRTIIKRHVTTTTITSISQKWQESNNNKQRLENKQKTKTK